MSEPRLRIVSDLHFAEHGSHLNRLSALEPLFDGVDQLIVNGDTLETRFVDVDAHTRERKAEWQEFAATKGDQLLVIAGNHDPDLTDLYHVELAGGAILITHGDIMFPEMAPWGWEAKYFKDEQERLMALEPEAARATLETRLEVCKRAILNTRDLSPRYPRRSSHPWERRLRFLWSLRRVGEILKAWQRTPAAAAEIAAQYRPEAQVVIVGHTHRPGVWRVGKRWVINTGSLVPFLGAMAADVVGNRIEVRRYSLVDGAFKLGKLVRAFEISLATEPVG